MCVRFAPPLPPCVPPRAGLISAEDVSMYLGDSFDKSNMEEYMREVSSRSDGLVRHGGFVSAVLHRARWAETWHSRPW